jgi:hypothetical protein
MKKFITYIPVLFIFISCKKTQSENFYNLLNQKFLVLTDTVGYDYHTFFLIPFDTIKPDKSKFRGYEVCIDKKVPKSKKYIDNLKDKLDKRSLTVYSELLNQSVYNINSIDLNKLTRTGKYKIVDSQNCKENDSTLYVGSIKFYQPYINETHAIIFFSKQSSEKAGVLNAFLFKNNNDKWELENKMQLERW